MKSSDLVAMIMKRHEPPAWQVFTELSSGVSARDPRRADVVAMGLWPSQGMLVHGYECKVERRDVRRELRDPRKMEGVGKFCDFWWLAVADEKLIDGLIVPDSWGILVPRKQVLRVLRPAPKLKAAPLDRRFVAAVVRAAFEDWVPKVRHDEIVRQMQERITQLIQAHPDHGDFATLRDAVAKFEEASGIQIRSGWQGKQIGDAVAVLVDIMHGLDPRNLRQRSRSLRHEAERYVEIAKESAQHADQLDAIMKEFYVDPADAS